MNSSDISNWIAREKSDLPIKVDTPKWIEEYLHSEKIVSGLAAIRRDVHTSLPTAGGLEDQKILQLDEISDWSSILIRLKNDYTTYTSLARDVIVHIVESPQPLIFQFGKIHGVESFDDIPGRAHLEDMDGIQLTAGDTAVIPGGMIAVKTSRAVEGTTILRFNGPLLFPLSLAFDATSGLLLSTSFADSGHTERHFYVSMLQHLCKPDAEHPAGIFDDQEEMEAVLSFLERRIEEGMHYFTGWKIAQILARHKPATALTYMSKIAAEGPPNIRAIATAAIEKRRT